MAGKSVSLILLCFNITQKRFSSFEKEAIDIIKLGLKPEDFSKCVVVVATHYDRITSQEERDDVEEYLPKLITSMNRNLNCNISMTNVVRSSKYNSSEALS